MCQQTKMSDSHWLVWVYPGKLYKTLGVVTWLEVTKEMRSFGWRVDLIASGPNGKNIIKGVEVLCFSVPDLYFIRQFIFHVHVIIYILRNWKQIDVILFNQVSTFWFFPLYIMLFPFSKNRPLFVMDTRSVPMEPMDKATLKDNLRVRFKTLMSKIANKWADGQTAITKRMAEYQGIPQEKLWGTWTSGVNITKFSDSLNNRHWPRDDDSVIVIYIGTLNYERNLMTLSQSIVDANKQGLNFKLLLYGEGSEKRDLEAFAGQTNGIIDVRDKVPQDKVSEILTQAHIGALPFPDEDKYRVSSPIKLFEYMGAGLPILATRIVCHTDVIGTGDYVFWAEDATSRGMLNALSRIWLEKNKLPLMGQNAYEAAQNWTWNASACRLNNSLKKGISH